MPLISDFVIAYFMFQFLDMSSLQAALPNAELSSSFLGGVSEPWFPQNPTPYIPEAGQGRVVSCMLIQWRFEAFIGCL